MTDIQAIGDDGRSTYTISVDYKPLIAKLQAEYDKMFKEGERDYCAGIEFAIEEIEKYFKKKDNKDE